MKCWNQIWLCLNVAIVLSRLNPVAGSVKYPVYENRRHRQLFCWSQLGSEVQRTNHNSFHFPPILFIISNPSTIIIILNERILFYPGPRGFLLMFFLLFGNLRREALIEAPSREKKKASGQDRGESHFHAGSALDSCQGCHFLLTNHILKDI